MPKKKAKKKSAKAKKPAVKKAKRPAKTARKKLPKRKPAPIKKKVVAKKKLAAKTKTAAKKPAAKAVRTKAPAKKPVGSVTSASSRRPAAQGQNLDLESIALKKRRSESAVQSGDLQGISHVEGADSESVEELIEEGNAFEADIVSGVERAGEDDEEEVRTHEVPEDDVPSEYLDEE